MTDNELPQQSQNPAKNPEDWVTGDEPVTGPQASYLRTLMQQAGKGSGEFDPTLTKAQASELIEQLQQETRRGVEHESAGS